MFILKRTTLTPFYLLAPNLSAMLFVFSWLILLAAAAPILNKYSSK
jgi:hypothetical protein